MADHPRAVIPSATIIALIALPILVLLALVPFVVVVRQSFGEPATLVYWHSLLLGQRSSVVPFWTAQHSAAILWRPLQHSLVVAGLTTCLATGLGGLLAWLSNLTDLRFSRGLLAIAIFHLILPPFALAVAWRGLAAALHLSAALTYGPVPMIGVLTLHFYAFAYLLVGTAIRNLDAGLFEAAQIHGAWTPAILRRIALPLLAPAALASAGLIAFSALAAFAPMQVLGGGQRPYYVLATQIYSLYRSSLGDPRVAVFATGLALVLTLVALPPFLLFLRLLGDGQRYGSIGGRGHRRWLMGLGRWRQPLSWFCLTVMVLSVVVPLAALLLQSLATGLDLHLDPTTWSLAAYAALLARREYALSLANSFLLATVTATVGVAVTLPIAYALQRSGSRLLRGGLYLLTFLPFLLPGMVLGLTYFVLISRPVQVGNLWLSLRFLYGTLILAVIVSLVKHLPFGVQTHASILMQVDPVLEEAAFVFRTSFVRTLQRIFLPLLRNGVLVAWLLLFIFVFKEIDVLIFVYAPLAVAGAGWGLPELLRAPPLFYRVFSLINSEQHPELYAQGVALLLVASGVLLLITLLAARLGWRPLDQRPARRRTVWPG